MKTGAWVVDTVWLVGMSDEAQALRLRERLPLGRLSGAIPAGHDVFAVKRQDNTPTTADRFAAHQIHLTHANLDRKHGYLTPGVRLSVARGRGSRDTGARSAAAVYGHAGQSATVRAIGVVGDGPGRSGKGVQAVRLPRRSTASGPGRSGARRRRLRRAALPDRQPPADCARAARPEARSDPVCAVAEAPGVTGYCGVAGRRRLGE